MDTAVCVDGCFLVSDSSKRKFAGSEERLDRVFSSTCSEFLLESDLLPVSTHRMGADRDHFDVDYYTCNDCSVRSHKTNCRMDSDSLHPVGELCDAIKRCNLSPESLDHPDDLQQEMMEI